MRDAQNINQICQLPISYIGFIFYDKSLRFVGEDFDSNITNQIPEQIKKVGVFVNANEAYITSKIETYRLDCVQLHGNETPEFCRVFKEKHIITIKSFGIDAQFDFSTLIPYLDSCDYFLFDTKSAVHGGTGERFDWKILTNYTLEKPIFLSGGISVETVSMLKEIKCLQMHAFDINSKFELKPALKDVNKVQHFIQKMQQV